MSSPIRLAILDDYQQVAFQYADWSPIRDRLSIEVYTETIMDEDELVKRLKDFEIICANRERTKIRASLIDRLPKLRMISTTGRRNSGIDIAHAKEKGIIVCGTGYGEAGYMLILEHIWALVMATVRQIPLEDANIKNKNPHWQVFVAPCLWNKTLGLVGAGLLGKGMARIAKVFGMRVIAWSPHLTPERAEEAGVEFCPSKLDLFRQSDVISLHVILSDTTQGIITGEDLRAMKPTAYFINTSRGPLVDEGALIDVLKCGRIAGAGLDVYDIEPLPLDHPFRDMKNVVTTPHSSYVNDVIYKGFWEDTVENIRGYLDGNPVRVIGPFEDDEVRVRYDK